MTTITKERLLTIKQWRETYGPGSNVVLPAEEAEELARIALASLEAEPVAWTDEEELRDVRKYGFGEIFQCPPDKYADPRRVIPLYRVPDGMHELYAAPRMRLLGGWEAVAVAWKVTFTQVDQESNTFTAIYFDKAEVEHWVRLHKACDFRADITPLYAAPPVPDKFPREYIRGWPLAHSDYAEGWNDCREAMLKGGA